MNTLIVYTSKYGCTEKCAELLTKELNDKVDIINLKNAGDIDISKYDKVIIGGSIYIGRIQKEVTEFCSKNLDKLKEKGIGLFICGMQEGEAINTELNQNFPSELLNIAAAKEYLGGEFIFDKMNFMEKLIVKVVSKASSNKSNILKDNIHKFAQEMNAI
ncbi:flavodoxin domain-containing protein [Clostridium sp. YIM B02515]|uniref:Flavodoxin domain-containing protein n=1 Tax=Clostridium rhizosphaerae TaxID=2803861 RepID=A0ABS1TCH7_9CLOT|nr:flavodoxin domain-containing protein [Clostridium rhizosphaerae]MBL4937065.1 flavodoxin domain-containing protein [Clostridium rhizosphaerae]